MTNINFGIQSGFVLGANNHQKGLKNKSQNQSNQNLSNNQAQIFTTNPHNPSFSSNIAANNSHFANHANKETKEMKLKNYDKYFQETSTSPKGNVFNIIGLFSPGEFLNNAMENDKGKSKNRLSFNA